MATTDERLDRIIELLAAIAKAVGARVPGKRPPMSAEERAGWREVNRPRRGDDPGTPPEEFFARRPGRSV